MSELGQAASKIGEKIVDILDIFDLSFFISGAVGIGAAMVAFPDTFLPLIGTGPDDETSGAVLFGLVLGSYVIGLVCFSIGRPLRDRLQRIRERLGQTTSSYDVFARALEEHFRGAEDAQSKAAFKRLFGYDVDAGSRAAYVQAYTRMWAHVRSFPELSESFTLLKRYWILAASYDGIATALLLWAFPVWLRLPAEGSPITPILLSAGLVIASLFCMVRAQLYKRYQIEEIVATVAHWLVLVGRPRLLEIDKGDVELQELRRGSTATVPDQPS
ncbi:MAG: hypothetical protein H6712_02750 [Myxococcales bacterium]|nr:hypothetical protein [Myxococcales bacterium]MCB9712745.1 hypothetical protein [Myxococcales bacterium]